MPRSHRITVLAGPAGSGKTSELLDQYRSALEKLPIGGVLWLAPTGRSARNVRERLLADGRRACFQPGVTTFARFAEQILLNSSVQIQSIPEGMKRELLARLVLTAKQSGKLRHFTPISETNGFLDQVAGFVSELKRLEIWPEHFEEACRTRGLNDKDRELALIYTEYQKLLVEYQLYDAEGRFWEARDRLEKGQMRPFEKVRFIVADGFTDFTRTQQEILQILASRAEQTLISLPLETGKVRGDLFAKSQATLDELQRRHSDLYMQHLERKTNEWSAWSHIERKLFSHPREFEPLTDATGIEIVPTARQEGEIEFLARSIKRMLLTEKIPPQEIVVVFRNLTEVAPLVRETFGEFGLPFVIDAPRPLHETPCLLALVNVLHLVIEDWPYRRLLALIGSNFFAPQHLPLPSGEGRGEGPSGNLVEADTHGSPKALTLSRREREPAVQTWHRLRDVAYAQRVIRELQVSHGSARWLERIERRLAKKAVLPDAPPEDATNKSTEDTPEDFPAIATQNLLVNLRAILAKLPKSATPSHWTEVLQTLANDLGISAACTETEQASFDALLEALRDNERLSGLLGEPPPAWNLDELLAHVETALVQETQSTLNDETGCVRVIAAASVRSLQVPYLFVAGLAEQSFPPTDRDDRLYSDADGRDLIASGLRWVDRAERSREEMLLFYEVVTRATKRLVLSYPALDDKAQPLSPSPYLSEIVRICGEQNFPQQSATDLSPLAFAKQLLCPRDQRLLAVDSRRDVQEHTPAKQPEKYLAGLQQQDVPLANNISAALRLQQSRQVGGEYGPFEGMLPSNAVREKLSEEFGEEHCWSPSRLEQYAKCPHEFYLSRVLGIKPLPEISLELDHSTRGNLLHAALATLHRRVNAEQGRPTGISTLDQDALLRMYHEIIDDCLSQVRGDDPLSKALTEIDRRTLLEWGTNYLVQAKAYEQGVGDLDSPPLPAHFEVAFGPDKSDEKPDPISTETPYTLKHGTQTILFSGRIDRIDIGKYCGQMVFNIIDYKSGKSTGFKPADIEAGMALQLPLYTIAAEELLLRTSHVAPWRSGYWFVKEKGFDPKKALVGSNIEAGHVTPDFAWINLKKQIVARVVSLVQGIRAAQFPMESYNDECTSHCDFKTVCRVQQTRSLNKKWVPPQST